MAPLDIPVFVAAWKAIYTHFETIGYIPDQTVAYPPHTSSPIPLPDDDAIDQIPLHPLILELLPQLPYPVSYESSCDFEILPRTRAVPYTEKGELRNARDPLMYYLDEEPRVGGEGNVLGAGYLKPEEVLLTTQLPQGMTLILNVAEGVLREYDASGPPPGAEVDYPLPNDVKHPYNWPALPAIETVWSYVRKFETLEWIAFEGSTELGILEPFDREHQSIKQILMEEYGWPKAFRKEDWIRERGELRKKLVRELYEEFF